jgi:hypothetical protein
MRFDSRPVSDVLDRLNASASLRDFALNSLDWEGDDRDRQTP